MVQRQPHKQHIGSSGERLVWREAVGIRVNENCIYPSLRLRVQQTHTHAHTHTPEPTCDIVSLTPSAAAAAPEELRQVSHYITDTLSH